jgi:hypothetical protein
MAVLTTKARKKLKTKQFALPGGRYPIHDAAHARNALARISQYGSPAEQKKVRAAVAKKYPDIGSGQDSGILGHGISGGHAGHGRSI